jgi:sporulation protein YlmC with PRC-barrel domain
MKILNTVAAAALAVAIVPQLTSHGFAQSPAASSIVAQDHSMRSSKLIGMDVYDAKGARIGRIEDVLVRGSASEPVVVLSVGSFVGSGDKMVGVPVSHIVLKGDKASMAATKTELASMEAWRFNGLAGGGGG